MTEQGKPLARRSSAAEVDAFLRRVRETPPPGSRGRLVFAMDATASREPTWDLASGIQAEMFQQAAALGGLEVQLCWYRGFHEFQASPWLGSPAALLDRMSQVRCAAGHTQIQRVLDHVLTESQAHRINALVFVGDCAEEPPDPIAERAGRLGLTGVPAFLFHEGRDPTAQAVFRTIARLTHGAYCPFDAGSAQQLRDLLGAVAVYAAGGLAALEGIQSDGSGLVRQLTHQLRPR